ncbi:MAG: DNA primase, partial [Shimia sp.]
ADYEVVRLTLAEQLAKLHSERGLRREIEEAEEDLAYTEDEGLTWRLAEAARASESAGRPQDEDDADYDVAPNGAMMDRDERKSLDELLSRITFAKGRE